MSDVIIQAEGLGKKYRISHQPKQRYVALRDVLAQNVRNIFKVSRKDRSEAQNTEDFWALKDINFEIKQGEVVGIIGRNGAGKSTLLKLLSRITQPTEGKITLRGRLASLLEVGTGFHAELTGRENIFLNGSILGMSRREILANFDAIVEFAEVQKFIDTPVKHYSSGMYVRLAFAVAAHLNPEILVVDEVLAVGDAEFQKKCLGKMSEVARAGRTVLFVSHEMNAIARLCSRIIMLSSGKVLRDSEDLQATINLYLSPKHAGSTQWERTQCEYQNPWFVPTRFRITDEQGNSISQAVRNDQTIFVELCADVAELDPSLTIGFAMRQENGNLLYWSYQTDSHPDTWPKLAVGPNMLRVRLPCHHLNEGNYRLQLIGGLHHRQWLFAPETSTPTINLNIVGGLSESPLWMAPRPGLLAPVLHWQAPSQF